MKIEIRPIPGYPGYYARTDGVILSGWRMRGRGRTRGRGLVPFLVDDSSKAKPLKAFPDEKGYARISILKEGDSRHRTRRVHTLILKTFRGPRPENMESRHLDNNRMNAALSNLEWGTDQDNANDRLLAGTYPRGENNKRSQLTSAIVLAIRAEHKSGVSIKSIARKFQTDPAWTSRIVRGLVWRHLLEADDPRLLNAPWRPKTGRAL